MILLRRIVLFFLLVLPGLSIMAQASDSIINEYFRIVALFDKEKFKEDSILVEPGCTIKEGDTILIHQVKGAIWNNEIHDVGFTDTKFVGRFEFQIVQKKIQDTLVLRRPLLWDKYVHYDPSDVLQVIKVHSYKYFKSASKITAKAFDGTTGGVLAFIADTVDLSTQFDVSGKGFRGANPKADSSNAVCYANRPDRLNNGYFNNFAQDSAGLKGESIVEFDNVHRRGRMKIANGGGGGNGHYSGGGGGSSYGAGGNGGTEAFKCMAPSENIGGTGGFQLAFTEYFKKITFKPLSSTVGSLDTIPMAIFGGGGGSSVSNDSIFGSKGGNGGGIIIIIANVLKSLGGQILANGESVTESSAAGGAGGGGGGGILFDVNTLMGGKPTIQAKGGNGGNTLGSLNGNKIDTAGPGGGGGGGYVVYKGDSLNVYANISIANGVAGQSVAGNKSASSGQNGIMLGRLIIPLRGFLFNFMPPDQDICAGTSPKLFKASEPKGAANYKYIWRKGTDTIHWDTVSNVMQYQSGPLYDTTYFQRIVQSYIVVNGKDSVIDADYSNILTINVLPAIENNNIHTDTFEVCKQKQMPIVNGTQPTGGNGIYVYLWEDSINGSWSACEGINNQLHYKIVENDSIRLRRIVKSHVCISYSNIAKVDVLSSITGNTIKDKFFEIGNQLPPLKSDSLYGGKGVSDFKYIWQRSFDNQHWDSIASQSSLILENRKDTISYRRIVQSGYKNTCTDTSSIITVFMLETLVNNYISDDMLVCRLSSPTTDFSGTQVQGGDRIYKYIWEISYDSVIWDTSKVVQTLNYKPEIILNDCYFRRIAISGPEDACKNTSNSIVITTKPEIVNAGLLIKEKTICQNQDADTLFAENATGGDGPYVYSWFSSTDSINWNAASGNSDMAWYATPVLNDTTFFFRRILSGVCSKNSDTLKVVVLPSIVDNSLVDMIPICYGQKPDSILISKASGGDGSYIYKWIKSTDNASWNLAPGVSDTTSYQPDTAFTDYFLKRIVISGFNHCCIDSSNSLRIKVNSLPEASFEEQDDSLCLGDTYSIKLNISQGNALYELKFSDGYKQYMVDKIFSSDTLLKIKPDKAGAYDFNILSVSDKNFCNATSIYGNVKLKVFEVPKASVVEDTATCGLVASLKAFPGIGKGRWTSTYGANFMMGDSVWETDVEIKSDFYGNRVFTWTLNNGGCIDSAHQKVTFYQPPPDPLVGESKSGPYLFKTNLKAYLPILGVGKWVAENKNIEIEDPSSPESMVKNLEFGKNIFFWYVENGLCVAASDTFEIFVEDIKIPGGISPNNDGINDKFEIYGLEQAESPELTILNRWGKEVFMSKNYKNDWDGTFNGNLLPSDTYFYILKAVGRVYKGYLVIKR